jgi:acyl-CoA oxidase
LVITVRYALRRRQFRAPGARNETLLLDHPTHQRRLMPRIADVYAVHIALQDLVSRRAALGSDGQSAAATREVELLAAGIKAWASWNCTATLQACREACGGEGYMSVNRLPTLKADTDIFTTFEGDNTVLMLWLGRNLLGDPNNAETFAPDADQPTQATAPARWRQLFSWRAAMMRDEAKEEAAALEAAGTGAADATAQLQNRIFRVAQAHLDHILLERLDAAVSKIVDPDLATVLAALRDLFALGRLEAERGWYLERGLLTAPEARALPARVDAACARLAPHAGALVEAFGVPPASIGAPIALPAS